MRFQHLFSLLIATALLLTGIAYSFKFYKQNADPHPEWASARVKTIDALRKEHAGEKIPEEWIERTHRAAPGVDWRKLEAESMQSLIAQSKAAKNRSGINGFWSERGPYNIPGRVTDFDYNYQEVAGYALSDHGIVFRSDDPTLLGWDAQNDQFPLGLGVAGALRCFSTSTGRLIATGYMKVDNDWGIYYSQDEGLTWQKPNGLEGLPITGIRRLYTSGDTAWVFMQEYSPSLNTDYYTVYQSTNTGADFQVLYRSAIPVGDGGRHNKSDMWIPNDPQHPQLYLMLEDSLFIVQKSDGARTFHSLVSGQGFNTGLLTGCAANGTIHLTAYEAVGDSGKFYHWDNLDQEWQFKGAMTEGYLSLPFGPNSFTCSKLNPDELYFGGILVSKSTDGGSTWEAINLDPTGSYALYHGDVPKTFTTLNPTTGVENVFIGTDGGLYQKTQVTDQFINKSIPGMNNTQIYKMATKVGAGVLSIGTQDNGYCYTAGTGAMQGLVGFEFIWGGDVSNVATGDQGQTSWLWWLGDGCNYMGSANSTDVISTWSPYWQNGGVPYWEAPIWVSGHFPDRCYTAGFLNGSSGSHLIKVQAVPGTDAIGTEYPFDFEANFGGRIAAIAISPIDSNHFYVATENGYLCHSADGGQTWSGSELAPYLYPRVIHPSSLQLGEVWVGGSGYSNSPVFHSTDHGQTSESLNVNLPACRAEAFATNEEETLIFMATSIGPFAFDVQNNTWEHIAGTSAPLLQYMDVEYFPVGKIARFATFARGVWDFHLQTVGTETQPGATALFTIFPNPAKNQINIKLNQGLSSDVFRIVDQQGKILRSFRCYSELNPIDISTLSRGAYFIQSASTSVQFVKN
jgi:hypothetical protein